MPSCYPAKAENNGATFLSAPAANAGMTATVSENFDPIKTTSGCFRANMKAKPENEPREAPFDQERLTKLFREEYGVGGYNLRRIVRDQTQTTVTGLSRVRYEQLGIREDKWRDSDNERVSPTYAANEGQAFEWAARRPKTGHPGDDVLCRCVTEAVILPSKVQAWGGGKMAA